MSEMRDICSLAPVIPVLVIDQLNGVPELGQTLVEAGLPVLEVTMRTPVALDAVRLLTEVPGAVVGVGTLLTARDVAAARTAGARFGVSPGTTDGLLDAAEAEQLPMLPGAATATEVMRLRERGYELLKFFPAEAAGGIPMLKSLAGPLPQVEFCPTGGISLLNLRDYLALPNVVCVGGSWMAAQDKISAGAWQEIGQLAREAARFGSSAG